jgi:hypothetical protein
MLRRVALVITDVSEERSASFIRVTRIGELETTLAVTSNPGTLRRITTFLRSVPGLIVTANFVSSSPILVTLMKEALTSSETSEVTRTTRRKIPENTILHSHHRVNLKSYIFWEPSVLNPLHKLPEFHAARRFVIAFLRALHLSLSWGRPELRKCIVLL